MKLIGAGLPRTGTLSQKVGLEMLGLAPCYHMVNVLGNLGEAEYWRRALDGQAPWEQVFDGFQATVDWPGSFFYQELLDYYPDAKVLLSIRDSEGWVKSMRTTIWGLFYDDVLMRDLSTARGRVDPKWRSYLDMVEGMWEQSGLIDDGADTTSESMQAAFDRFNQEVQDTVPADRLLVWSAGDGWEPLCEFLELPVPDTPFPRLNDSAEFAGRIVDGALLTLREWRDQEAPAISPA
ncbi:MAG TPA: sulfotransferase [Solirubrobacteraceae bacterium]|nr:sulfotransferase [Solirubrobacteraceae bacterium]